MPFQAYCPHCKKKVTTHPILAGKELKAALDSNSDIQVMHTSDAGVHHWTLMHRAPTVHKLLLWVNRGRRFLGLGR